LKEAEAQLETQMAGVRYFALLRNVRAFRDELPGLVDQPAVAAARYVKKAERAVARRLDKVPHAEHHDEALHRVRKAAKRARYAAEVAEPALGDLAADAAARAKKTQRDLGNRQDAVLAAEFLLRLGAAGDGFTLGVLYERERARLQQ